jgi:hypothetical protein
MTDCGVNPARRDRALRGKVARSARTAPNLDDTVLAAELFSVSLSSSR